MTEILSPAEKADIRRFAADLEARGSRRASRDLRHSARRALINGHVAAARAAHADGREADMRTHLRWVRRLARRA